jgi:phospholipid/cholesterol/gamma-HCH transport system permease protein
MARWSSLSEESAPIRVLAFIGSLMLSPLRSGRGIFETVAQMLLFLAESVVWFFRPPVRFGEFSRQLDFVGTQSVLLIVLTGAFTGMVSALQSYIGMSKYGAQSMVGATVALALTRELGPVITALMVVGRVGSAMTAELGSMRNTQQIDALESMAVNSIQYLVVPRIFASTVVMPVLALIFSLAGMVGAYLISTQYLNVDAGMFMSSVQYYLDPQDVRHGAVKAVVFGLITSLVACYKGYYATGGSRGVGIATTRSVVLSSVLVLISDYVMTNMMFHRT